MLRQRPTAAPHREYPTGDDSQAQNDDDLVNAQRVQVATKQQVVCGRVERRRVLAEEDAALADVNGSIDGAGGGLKARARFPTPKGLPSAIDQYAGVQVEARRGTRGTAEVCPPPVEDDSDPNC